MGLHFKWNFFLTHISRFPLWNGGGGFGASLGWNSCGNSNVDLFYKTLKTVKSTVNNCVNEFSVSAPGSKEAAFSRFSAILVPSHDMETSMEADVQAEVDEIVKKVQDHKDLLGEIVHFAHVC